MSEPLKEPPPARIVETPESWAEANQRFLMAEIEELRHRLERVDDAEAESRGRQPVRREAQPWSFSTPPAIETLASRVGLSAFEREVVLLCAGVELDSSLAGLCARASATGAAAPTFGLALAALTSPHWSALAPDAPLRHWRMIEVGRGPVTEGPLRIDERILHFLAGLETVDEGLSGFLLRPAGEERDRVPSGAAMAHAIAQAWTRSEGPLPLIQLRGEDGTRSVAAAAAAAAGRTLLVMPEHVLPTTPHELDVLIRIWARESLLGPWALLVETEGEGGTPDSAREAALRHFLENAPGALLVAGRERRVLRHRPVLTFEIEKLGTAEQRAVWEAALGPDAAALNGAIDRLTAHFRLAPAAIHSACGRAAADEGGAPLDERLWRACREQSRPRLGNLAQRIEPRATWNDLVLPPAQTGMLRDISIHLRQRTTVYESWGFAARSDRGLGISALFAGPSGTGKTMAAEVLANDLCLDLYRIDLSAVVSKYIGETEKNLARVFDAAEEAGAILLFDEADALFGKRTEVRDSHDRYANIEVSYLLQRMESYRGLAILTTNLKGSIDDAFLRRLRFVVNFPFPDAQQREEIWRRTIPPATPTSGLDYRRLARLNITGGNIRNVAMNAAFIAAEAGTSLGMAELLRATRAEFAKLDRPLTDAEIRGWA